MPTPGDSAAPKRGEVWFANLGDLDPSKGAEIQKKRPVLIVGKNIINQHRRTVLVIPLGMGGGNPKANPPVTIEVHCSEKSGVAVIDQLRALDKQRLLHLVDTIEPDEMDSVMAALCQILEIS